MYVSAGGPYQNNFHPYYTAAYEERRQLRRTSNGVNWTALAGILFMQLLLPVACTAYLKTVGFHFTEAGSFNGIPPVLYYLLVSVDYVVGLALPAFLYFAVRRIPLENALPFRKTHVTDVAIYVLFGCMVCMLANYPANWVSEIQQSFGFSGNLREMPLNNDARVLILYGMNVIVIPPLVEEIMFRGVILQSLRRYGDGFAVMISAMMFGLYHGNFIQMVFAFICGLVMGFVVIRTNSLLPSILIHFINNSVSLVVEMVSRYYGQNMANYVDNIVSLAIVALGIIAFSVLVAKRQLFSRKGSGSILPFSSRMGAAFANPGAFAFVAYALVSSFYTLYRG